MKVLVVGSDRDACIEFANALNASESGTTAIIGGLNYSEAVGRLGREIDAIAMLSERPIADAIEANRNQKVRAAVCRNAGDVRDATSCGANLFVVSAFDAQRHQTAAVAAMIGKSNGMQDAAVQDKRRSQQVAAKQPKKQDDYAGPADDRSGTVSRQRDRKQDDYAGSEDDAEPGIKSRLRDIFGIE